MEQVAGPVLAALVGREADREALRQGAENCGGAAALVRERYPRLAASCPAELSVEALVAETVAWYEDAEARLGLCARCPPAGGACHGASTLFKPGQLPVWRGESVQRERCERYREWRLGERLAVSNVPERYRSSTVKAFERQTAAQRATYVAVGAFSQALVQGTHPWLVISGPPGSGKTHLGCAVLRNLPLTLPRKHFWYSDMNELRIQMKAYNFNSGEPDPMDRVRDTEVLVFDNLDVKGLAREAWLMERVEGALYQRWNRGRATLITTHGTFKEIITAFPGITTLKEAPSCSLA